MVGVEGSPVSVCGVSTLQLDIAGTTFVSDFVVVDMLCVDCIVGSDFLKKYGGVIDLSKNTLQFRNVTVPLEEVTRKTSSNHTDRCSREHDELQVALVETLAIPPFSAVQAVATVSSTEGTGTWLVEGSRFDLPIPCGRSTGDTIARWAGTHTNHKPPTNRGSHLQGNKCGHCYTV